MTVVEATFATQVASINPSSITDGVATSITLSGAVDDGDMVRWVESSVACNTVIPDVDPTDGTDASTDFTVAGAGAHKLCHRDSGGSAVGGAKWSRLPVTMQRSNTRRLSGLHKQ